METPSNNRNNNEDQNAPITVYQRATIATCKQSTHRLMKISSIAVETSRSTSKVTLS